jgi:cytochrome oxidase Cu insertion factor (SCO1/SenC/PrrC family)
MGLVWGCADLSPALRSEEPKMPQVEIDAIAPDFTLTDFRGVDFTLSRLRHRKSVVLVFNRGFT